MLVKLVSSREELETAFRIRKAVFIDEQAVPPEEELDEHEWTASHVLVYCEGDAVGTGRVRLIGEAAKLERICVLKPYRQHHIGTTIVRSLEAIAKEKGATEARLNGQVQAERFYRKLGYRSASDVFLDAGIAHVLMVNPRL